MGILKERFKAKADAESATIKELLKEHGNKKIGEVALAQIYQGMRGITGLVSETSLLDAQDGIRFRGYSIPELHEKLPKAPNGTEPLPEGIFYLRRATYRRRRTLCYIGAAAPQPCTGACIFSNRCPAPHHTPHDDVCSRCNGTANRK